MEPFEAHELHRSAEAVRDAVVPAVLRAADPADAVARAPMPPGFTPRVLLATGKASAPMVEATLPRIEESLERGAVTCVPAHEVRLRETCARHPFIEIRPADHPLATERNLRAASSIADAARASSLDRLDTLVLVSGGASAHLTSPVEGLSLDDLRSTTDALLRAGATISELNTVRKHCETLKGGRLARLLAPARTHVLVLSDVLGDPLDTIGSGPTAPDRTTLAEARGVLERYAAAPIPQVVRNAFDDPGGLRAVNETPKPRDPCFGTITHDVIANNAAARIAAARSLEALGFNVTESRAHVTGEAAAVAKELVGVLAGLDRGAAVVFAGETTVTVGDAPGVGGRNQELALAASIALQAVPNAVVITLATDGIDGPTDAAGAVVTTVTAEALRSAGIDPCSALAAHDSHAALDRVGALIRTGPTGTNINDIALAIRL